MRRATWHGWPDPPPMHESTANMLLTDVLMQCGHALAMNRFLRTTYGIDFRAVERARRRAQGEIDARRPQSTSKPPAEPRKHRS
jgi:hypothetical protein